MPLRPCLDCRRPTNGNRCDQCRRSRDKARGTRQQRGYDADYDEQLRDPAYLAATHCTTCGDPFTDDNPKTGGHSTALRHGGAGSPVKPQCARCNFGWRKSGA